MEQSVQPSRRRSILRVLAAALAGAIGAFGVPDGAHAAAQPASAGDAPPHAQSSGTAPD